MRASSPQLEAFLYIQNRRRAQLQCAQGEAAAQTGIALPSILRAIVCRSARCNSLRVRTMRGSRRLPRTVALQGGCLGGRQVVRVCAAWVRRRTTRPRGKYLLSLPFTRFFSFFFATRYFDVSLSAFAPHKRNAQRTNKATSTHAHTRVSVFFEHIDQDVSVLLLTL